MRQRNKEILHVCTDATQTFLITQWHGILDVLEYNINGVHRVVLYETFFIFNLYAIFVVLWSPRQCVNLRFSCIRLLAIVHLVHQYSHRWVFCTSWWNGRRVLFLERSPISWTEHRRSNTMKLQSGEKNDR